MKTLDNTTPRPSCLCPFALAAAFAASLAVPAVYAQQYPSKPIRIIVAAAPGGGTDFVARIVAQRLTETMGQQVIVENRAGAGSTLGHDAGMRAAPDGTPST